MFGNLFKTALFLFVCFVTFHYFSCKEQGSDVLPDLSERLYAGGATTVFSQTSNAYRTPATGLTEEQLSRHLVGDLQFESVFVTAPAKVNSGLGPIFNHSSCISCHPRDGRSPHPNNFKARSGLLVRSSMPGKDFHGGPVPVQNFGLQIQNQSLFGYIPEADYEVNYTFSYDTLSDGIIIELRKPEIFLSNTYLPFPKEALLSPRIGMPVIGLGLLEIIPENDILKLQDINDIDNDGISGKANFVWDPITQSTILGRFGWKANTGTLLVQCASAYVEDMGITNYVFKEETGYGQENGSDGITDDPELPDHVLDDVTFYTQTLAVPAPRNINDTKIRKGAAIFEQIGCEKCHTPQHKTGYSDVASLSYQTIYPYTDMLLHDMGDEMSDNRPDFLAEGNEWKTRPLWGIGLTQLVNGHAHFLHDGRARSITEAILWHGGEAENAKNKFKKLTTDERNNLLAFINSL